MTKHLVIFGLLYKVKNKNPCIVECFLLFN